MTPPAPDAPDRRPAPWAIMLAFGLVYVCWGTTYFALKKGVQDEHWPPALFGGVRICIAGTLILLWQALRGQQVVLPARDRLPVALCALFLFVGGNGLLNLGGLLLPSSVCAVLAATTPLWMAVFGLIWPKGDRLAWWGWLGLLLGLVGVLLLWMPKLDGPRSESFNIGVLCMLGSGMSWAIGSLIGRHCRLTCSHVTAAGYQLFIGGTCLSLIGVACGELGRLPDHITATSAGAFIWLLLFGSMVGFIAYNWLLAHVPVTQIGTYAYVNPVIAVIIGIAVDEPATVGLFVGIVVILLGVALVRRDGRRQALAGEAKAGHSAHRQSLAGTRSGALDDGARSVARRG